VAHRSGMLIAASVIRWTWYPQDTRTIRVLLEIPPHQVVPPGARHA